MKYTKLSRCRRCIVGAIVLVGILALAGNVRFRNGQFFVNRALPISSYTNYDHKTLISLLPPPRSVLSSDLLSVLTYSGSEVKLGRGSFGEVKLVYYKPKELLAALKSVWKEQRNRTYGPRMYQEAALAEFIRQEGGFTTECYGIVDNFTGVWELIAQPPVVNGMLVPLPTPTFEVINESLTAIVPSDIKLTGSSIHTLLVKYGKHSGAAAWRHARERLTAVDWLRVCCQLMTTLAILHSRGIVHRDIKVDNLFLRWSTVDNGTKTSRSTIDGLLSDFTISGLVNDNRMSFNFNPEHPNTILERPPELRNKKGTCNTENDIWHFGRAFDVVYRETDVGSVNSFKAILDRMMTEDPRRRATAVWVRDSLLALLPSDGRAQCIPQPMAKRWLLF